MRATLLYNSASFPLDPAVASFLAECPNVARKNSGFTFSCPIDGSVVHLLFARIRDPSNPDLLDAERHNLRRLLALATALGHSGLIREYSLRLQIPANPLLYRDAGAYRSLLESLAAGLAAIAPPAFPESAGDLPAGPFCRYSSFEECEYAVPVLDNDTPLFFKSADLPSQYLTVAFSEPRIVSEYSIRTFDFKSNASHLKSWRLIGLKANGDTVDLDEVSDSESEPLNSRSAVLTRRFRRSYSLQKVRLEMIGENRAGTRHLVVGSLLFPALDEGSPSPLGQESAGSPPVVG
jgi:hypothetical protein